MARVMSLKRTQNRTIADAPFISRISEIKADHPLWGYRRVWAYMRFRDGLGIGKNRVYRLMSEAAKLVPKNELLRAKRLSNLKKPRAKVPNQFWGIGMMIRIQGWGWVYFHLVIDWYTKEIFGKNVTLTSKTQDWLEDLHLAVQSRFPNGIRLKRGKPKLISDNGCQPTSISFMENGSTLGIKQNPSQSFIAFVDRKVAKKEVLGLAV